MELLASVWMVLKFVLLVFFVAAPILWHLSEQFRYYVKMTAYNMTLLMGSWIISLIVLPFSLKPNTDIAKLVFDIFKFLSSWTGIYYIIRNDEILHSDNAYVLVVNHQSSLDVVGMSYTWPKRCVVMLKRSLIYVPGFNIAAVLANSIFIDRFNRENARKSVEKSVEAIKRRNVKVWVFPEGTRNHEKGLLPFKKGAFHMAIEAKIPIVPMVISSIKPFYSKADKYFRPGGPVIAQVLDPIPTEDMTADDVTKLAELTRSRMLDVYDKISEEAALLYSQEHPD
uniref:1-acyl-sn-glycerol-3-phosphate acyltransferase n=1 Tax=Plectus sambesii TaxID=2011161 RepID=A0A914WSP2_9BILA